MHGYFNYQSTDDEKRILRRDLDRVRRAVASHKQRREEAEHKVKEWQKKYQEVERENEQLKKEIEEIRRQRDTYKNMLFKNNVDHATSSPESSLLETLTPKKKRGGQQGHLGHGRMFPCKINCHKRVYAKICPDCHTKLKRTSATTTHTVEDIPAPSVVKPIVTQYSVERQWCTSCNKEVTAKPVEVIPGSKLGINLVTYIMLLKYGATVPLDAIVLLLANQYGLRISKGGIVQILHRTKRWLGPAYQRLKEEIRASPLVHADETGWRVEGVNNWIWAFLSKDAVCYQVEETRGKGVPQDFFKNSNPHAVLVRDDYAAYQGIDLPQQSCWAHMLRNSHKEVTQETASWEMRELHQRLKNIYARLDAETQQPFDVTQRQSIYDTLLNDIRGIIRTPYTADDAIRIQKRVRNQNKNVLTALLYEGVPLTNNHAERTIRPLVVTRKISGGSRSTTGAQTHMVNMSIFQTIKLKNQPLIPTLQKYLLAGAIGNY